MEAPRSPTVLIAVALVASGLSVAAPATAHDLSQKPTADEEYTYVGMGLGDYMVDCLHDHTPGSVSVRDPLNGGLIFSTPVPEPNPRVCRGGALKTITHTAAQGPPVVPSDWSVWIDDVVWNTDDPNTYPVSAFAEMRIEIVQKQSQSRVCAPDTYTKACLEPVNNERILSKRVGMFGFCGAGETGGIDDDFHEKTSPSDIEYRLKMAVFVDGPVYLPFTCIVSFDPWWSIYNTSVDIWNASPTCTVLAVCLFDNPSAPASCWIDRRGDGDADWENENRHQIAADGSLVGMGTAGTIGWLHSSSNWGCEESPNEDPNWFYNGGTASPDVEVDNFPVTVDGNTVDTCQLSLCYRSGSAATE